VAAYFTPPDRGGRVGYGIDEHRTIIELAAAGVLSVLVGLLVSGYTVTSQPQTARLGILVGPAVGFLILVVTGSLYWSSRRGKIREMGRLIASIPFGGEEVVLDLGCGRGLGMVKAAKNLTSGIALGVDTWQKSRLSGNDPRSIWANARAEGVESNVSAVRAVPTYLPISDRSVDVAISGVAIHKIVRRRERRALFAELARVLKDGGRVGILDAGNGNEYSSMMKESGMTDVEMHRLRFSGFPPFHVVMARKPYGG
jgi:ubiquinone/menaquinone biosynthesis C-methylase UbiE